MLSTKNMLTFKDFISHFKTSEKDYPYVTMLWKELLPGWTSYSWRICIWCSNRVPLRRCSPIWKDSDPLWVKPEYPEDLAQISCWKKSQKCIKSTIWSPRLINNNLFYFSTRREAKIIWKWHLPFRIRKSVVLDENMGEKWKSQTKETCKITNFWGNHIIWKRQRLLETVLSIRQFVRLAIIYILNLSIDTHFQSTLTFCMFYTQNVNKSLHF